MDFSNLLSMAPEIWQASLETALMLGIGLTVAIVLGGPLGIVLFLTQPGRAVAHRALNGVLGWLVNLVRSFPFIILMVSLVPLTRLLVGSTIGPVAAAVPLSFAAIPFCPAGGANPARSAARRAGSRRSHGRQPVADHPQGAD